MKTGFKQILWIVVFSGWCLVFSGVTLAQNYTIGEEDVLSISFWQKPTLNFTAKVETTGKTTLPMIGEMQVAGFTPSQMADEIVAKMSVYDPSISQAMVTVLEYNSRRVYITGEVLHPGKYAFERLPDLWMLLSEAGGPTDRADLSAVIIIHQGEPEKPVIVDLKKCLKNEIPCQLPKLEPKDIVNIPPSAYLTTPPQPGPISLVKEGAIYIWGEVASPGVFRLEEPIDLTEALSLAGGPTAMADLKKVRIVKKGEKFATVVVKNLELHLEKGEPLNLLVEPKDILVVPAKKPGTLAKTWGTVRDVLTVAAGAAGIYLVYDTIKDNR
jgi:polysaccharide biosynthesis/export protein